jgi:metal-sulfur cluster biosynthetic enzyme
LESRVWAELRQCLDPEIPLSIVELGLVYEVAASGGRVDVKLTLTSPNCHMGGRIAAEVQSRLLAVDGVEEANIEFVWDPPWNHGMISPEGRQKLGL